MPYYSMALPYRTGFKDAKDVFRQRNIKSHRIILLVIGRRTRIRPGMIVRCTDFPRNEARQPAANADTSGLGSYENNPDHTTLQIQFRYLRLLLHPFRLP